ncbi:MAG: exodeoxyribonuclease VII large subunit [Candidatus Rokuibacteriota bacterium]
MSERAVLSVSELTTRLRELIEERFPAVWVEGEISNFRLYASGHAYFTLKDAAAQLPAALFRTRVRRLRFEPRDGMHVLAFGSLEVYAQRGGYQLIVELLEPRGVGALQLAFEQLKGRLEREGLFEAVRKRPLPSFPRRIGLVTSPDGAALRDILRVIGRRFRDLSIVIAPAKVQGEGASAEIAQGLAALNALGDIDVIICGRGGGSLEDLWAFNEEVVARAIAASKVPVVSAVGHEIDFTIADFVADLRAPTPSAAAELVVREKQAVVERVRQLRGRLMLAMGRNLTHQRGRMDALARRRVLTDPGRPVRERERRVDDARVRLHRAGAATLGRATYRVELVTAALRANSPFVRIKEDRRRLEAARLELINALGRQTVNARHRLGLSAGHLNSLSPLAVLGRGYSLTRLPSGVIVRSTRQVSVGADVRVLLDEGRIDCRVEATWEDDERPQV